METIDLEQLHLVVGGAGVNEEGKANQEGVDEADGQNGDGEN